MTAPTAIYTVPFNLLAEFSMNGLPNVDGGVMVGTINDEDDVFQLETEEDNDGRDLKLVRDTTFDVDFDTVAELAVVVTNLGRSLLTSEIEGIKFFPAISASTSFWML